MDSGSADVSDSQPVTASNAARSTAVDSAPGQSTEEVPSKLSTSGISSWAKNLKIPQPFTGSQDEQSSGNAAKSTFARFTGGFGMRMSPKSPTDENSEGTSTSPSSFIGTFTKGLVDSSKNAVKAVQVKARHVVSQNKRRYQEGGFDLDLTYITENIIAMGFPAGDMSSGIFGYVEGFYRNHMEEVIKFFETHHKDKYKVYNLCSERLYDASLFEGKVACFPFDDHNCPPIQLIISFCQSAYSWLKEDIENVVVVHCKAGMARTGLMISSLLLYLKFFPTAEESMDYYNQKRCVDGKGLVLPSQIRYVKYFERILMYFNGENQPGRRCMLRGFRLHRCPYWIRPSITVSDHNGVLFSTKKHPRTKDLSPEDFWFSAPKKGVMVFALPGEPGLAELAGDFKIHFHDGQGDFYCWLNTTMIENRKVLTTGDLDGFDKRKLPSPGFQVEVVLVDYDAAFPARPQSETATKESADSSSANPAPGSNPTSGGEPAARSNTNQHPGNSDKDDVFSDNESEETGMSKTRQTKAASEASAPADAKPLGSKNNNDSDKLSSLTHKTEQVSLGGTSSIHSEPKRDGSVGATSGVEVSNPVGGVSDFKVVAADASVFSFGDEEDYESE
ncbi:phosphatidylinositol 3,4,5-trisphosphate 3-phosphatase and protein-tyrosine-phosphatase PTEN2A [Nicotiana tabacum]|uniref:Phosphatidylinositol 3,4,5-trisphosphate 3-phosphatase and protein-tyrosine-phosphatase PTEN2A n=4 Tax=Nicotiana tabacum TaxID=4097 RepID=A0A1S4A2D9_TOBAC|nr:phosphatidylinositol 3,4,5-trisphosphate 3-phosphatase and protein-tyrosine-phosphatase PTEN2A [Nicotiana tomentosiformis]XP_016470852.1 PREDICTED: phosphatidylinositol 3,4,5-trisphosphate 3-phosphatase and protein-tyrosine-phosphatase PTEN2A-like [Nicotiana tabacum]XP_018627924.1 phosphatidylinositol 3,4,5-trisphosphate 3-phosphatase and protein-tyrosine-phosphatase PTEN2A [Nicotiana tomentosiformis]